MDRQKTGSPGKPSNSANAPRRELSILDGKYSTILKWIGRTSFIVVSVLLVVSYDLFEKIVDGTREYETWELDEILSLSLIFVIYLAAALVWKGRLLKRETASRKDAELTVSESEEKYRNLFNGAQVALARTSVADGSVLECNDFFARLVGYNDQQDCIDQYLAEAHYPEPGMRNKVVDRIRKEVEFQNIEAQIKRRDGSLIWVSYSSLLCEEQGYIETAAIDITEKKRVEEALLFTQFAMDQNDDATYWIKPDGRISNVNRAACSSLGYSDSELRSMAVMDIDVDFAPESWPAHWKEVKEAGSSIFESRHKTKAGRLFPVEILTNYIERDGQEFHCAFVRDISERKSVEHALVDNKQRLEGLVAERTVDLEILNQELENEIAERKEIEISLRKNQERFRAIFLASPVSVWEEDYSLFRSAIIELKRCAGSDIRGYLDEHPQFLIDAVEMFDVIDVNDESLRMFEADDKEALLSSIGSIFTPGSMKVFKEEVIAVAEGARTFEAETEVKTLKGSLLNVVFAINYVGWDTGSNLAIVTMADITERIRAEEELMRSRQQLRSLAGHLQKIREMERASISREIHDELGQVFTGINLDIGWLQEKLSRAGAIESGGEIHEKLTKMSTGVRRAIDSVREICSKLRPSMLDDLGLNASLRWLAGRFEDRTNVECEVIISVNDQGLTKDISTSVFRIFQEALTNVTRHSKATRVAATLEERNGDIVLEIRDNGTGFNGRDLTDPGSYGLIGMQERAFLLGGEMAFGESEFGGALVTLRLPREATRSSGAGRTTD